MMYVSVESGYQRTDLSLGSASSSTKEAFFPLVDRQRSTTIWLKGASCFSRNVFLICKLACFSGHHFCCLTSTTSSLRVPTSVKNLTFLARLVSIRYGAGHKKKLRGLLILQIRLS